MRPQHAYLRCAILLSQVACSVVYDMGLLAMNQGLQDHGEVKRIE